MFAIGQKVLVITDNGITYDAVILATAKGDDGPGAYKVTMPDSGPEQPGQWHKACEVFVPDPTWEEKKETWENFLKE